MTDEIIAAGADAGGEGLDVQLAQELVEQARQEGVSLVGRTGLLAGAAPNGVASRLGCRAD